MIPLHSGEEILAVRRKSWFIFATTSATAGLLLLAPIALFFVLAAPKIEMLFGSRVALYIFLSSFWEWLVWLWLFVAVINYYLDVFIVTNERIVHIEQKGLFHRTISELRLSRVQDVQIEHRGFVETFMHFGTLTVQSAAEKAGFVFYQMDRPETVKEIIMTAHRKAIPREYAGIRAGNDTPPPEPPQNPPPPAGPPVTSLPPSPK